MHARNLMLAVLAAAVTLTSVASAGRDVANQSQTASPAVSARLSLAAQAGTSRIAFTSIPHPPPVARTTVELYVVNADGTDKRVLARSRTFGAWGVVWSPDGRTIAFHGHNRVNFINDDGSGRRNVTREWGLSNLPVWSPDGRRMAFMRCQGGQRCDIHVVNADGSRLRRLAPGAFPSWSPNGKKIAFLRDRVSFRPDQKPHYLQTPEVWVMDADGSGQRRLTRGFPTAWSPDGRKIALTGLTDTAGVYVVNADGSGLRRLTRTAGRASSGAWSPDGMKILFVVSRPGTRGKVSNVYVMNADGSGQRRLAERGHNPRWSPDGAKISFVTNRDGNSEVYVMNADGSEQLNVSRSRLRDDLSPVWSPK
jgi:Tol biopolymer transport system component